MYGFRSVVGGERVSGTESDRRFLCAGGRVVTSRMSSSSDRRRSHTPTSDPVLQSGLDQFREECYPYNRAVGSYNTHLANHRERRALHDIPFRAPITAHERFEAALAGERAALEAVLAHLIDGAHLDSQLRRHPRTYPIHREAVDHLEVAREQLVTTLEETIQRLRERDD